jgi:hypothetical protein
MSEFPSRFSAIYAFTHDFGRQAPATPQARAAQAAVDEVIIGAQVTAFERGLPFARVV